jgi:hypothetical protein
MVTTANKAALPAFGYISITSDFTFSTYRQTKIVTPKEYWDNYQPD